MPILTLLLAACGGGDATSPDDDHQGPTLGVSLDPATIAVPKGTSGNVAVTVVRGGYSGNVSFQVEGAPGDVTISFAPHPLTGTATSSTMTIAAAATATAARHLMTVHASNGANDVGAPLWLDVLEPPDYSLKAARDTLRVIQGSTGQVDVTITRVSAFTGGVTLGLDGAPAGVTGTFDPNPATGDRSTLTVTVGSGVAAGKQTLTVKGTAAGLPDRTTTFVLDVASAATPGFTLGLTPPSLSILPGGTGVSTHVSIRRSGGFTGAVSVAPQGHPTGVTWTCVPPSPTDTAATLTFTASPVTPAGTYAVVVYGTAPGLPASQTSLQLTVQVVAGFTFQLSSNSISTAPGAAPQTLTVKFTRTGGFADTVRLSMTGLPAGITATFNPPATVGDATLTIAATAAATPGTYTGMVHAAATGFAERTTLLTVTVLAGSTNIVWRFCSPNPTPVFFAAQDGLSPAATVSPGADGSYVTGFASGRGAIVVVVPGLPDTVTASSAAVGVPRPLHRVGLASATDVGYTTYTYSGSIADLQQLAPTMCPAAGPPRTVYGSVAGVPADNAWTVALGGASAVGLPGAGTSFTLRDVLSGSRDLVAARAPYSENDILASALVIRRDLQAADGSTLPVIDFAAAEAFAPATGTLTVSGLPGTGDAQATLGLLTANGTEGLIGQLSALTGASRLVVAVPASRLRAGDLHTVTATSETNNPPLDLSAKLYAAALGAWTLSIASPPPLPMVDVYAVSPVVRLRARGVTPPGSAYDGMVRASFVQADRNRAFVVYQSRGFTGTTQNYEIRTGVYTALAGWNEALYGLQTGARTIWGVEQISAGYAFAPSDGAVLRTMHLSGELVP